jgi:hypothetical protein
VISATVFGRAGILRRWLILLGTALIAVAIEAPAHDARPAYLEIRQTTSERYDVLWRTPVLSGMRLPVLLKLPDGTATSSRRIRRSWRIRWSSVA